MSSINGDGKVFMMRKILIVDDSQVARRILKSCIQRAEDYAIHEAEDGAAGLEAYRNIRPDVTFLDLNMPRLDGLACLRKVREIDPSASVIICTSEAAPGITEEGIAAGAMEVIRKPPTRETIERALAKVTTKVV